MTELNIKGISILSPLSFHRRRKPIYYKKNDEVIKKIRIKECENRKSELNNYLAEIERINNELKNVTNELTRVKSLNRIAAIKENILRASCNFE
jgi:hypothetical protein